jgi:hypothetical protein
MLLAVSRGFLSGILGSHHDGGEKIEQRVTGRPNSYVPARTISRLLGAEETQREIASKELGYALGHRSGAGCRTRPDGTLRGSAYSSHRWPSCSCASRPISHWRAPSGFLTRPPTGLVTFSQSTSCTKLPMPSPPGRQSMLCYHLDWRAQT